MEPNRAEFGLECALKALTFSGLELMTMKIVKSKFNSTKNKRTVEEVLEQIEAFCRGENAEEESFYLSRINLPQ